MRFKPHAQVGHLLHGRSLLALCRLTPLILLLAMLLASPSVATATNRAARDQIVIGGKKFTESYVLGEIMAQLLEDRGFKVQRRFGLGGTLIAYRALLHGEIDVYPEYTGTISQVILKHRSTMSWDEINSALKSKGLVLLPALGFNNTYAIAVRETFAQLHHLRDISDLRGRPYRAAFDFEFLKRQDGWRSLRKEYGLALQVRGMEHNLTYEAIREHKIDVIDLYTTDPKISRYKFRILDDDKHFFPKYIAAPLATTTLPAHALEVLALLKGRIDNKTMVHLNSEAELNGQSFAQVAHQFLMSQHLLTHSRQVTPSRLDWWLLGRRTLRHLYLTFTAVLLACLLAIPLGIVLLRWPVIANYIIAATGLLQTVPSIALLAFMIPFFGIGVKPAIIALFLYSLLPILRNTYVGLKNIDPQLLETGRGLGLYRYENLLFVQLPLGLPVILAGIRTATVIDIGTATLAAFIGAGGLGEPIVTGLSLNNNFLLMQGAIPAALLALLAELAFGYAEKRLTSR